MAKQQVPELDQNLIAQLSGSNPAALNPAVAAMNERKRFLLSKVRLLRDGEKARASMVVQGNPDYKYFWVFNHPQEVSNFLGREAQVVEEGDEVQTDYKGKDGRHYRGDTVLMRMHKDLVEAWDADRDLRAVEASEGAKTNFDEWAQGNGVPVKRKQ